MGTNLAIIERELTARLPAFAQVLPRDLPPERLMRTVLVSCERTPALLDCSQQSIMNSALTAAVLALEVDGVTGQGFLLPFAGKAQFIVGYKGYPTIGARSGISINSGVVREGDEFDYQLGTAGYVKHKPALLGRKGRKIIAAWAAATASDRPASFVVLPYDDVLAIKAKSFGARKPDSPWNDVDGPGHEAMCAKTAILRVGKFVPIVAMQRAVALGQQQEMGNAAWLRQDGAMIIDATASPYPERQPGPAGELTAPPRPRWVLPDGSERSWSNVDLMLGTLLREIDGADPDKARAARERNAAVMAELSAAGFTDQMHRLSDALAKCIGEDGTAP